MIVITRAMRDVLIEHIDGSASVPVDFVVSQSPKLRTVRGLVARGWLRPDPGVRPRRTHITLLGREALCHALADWAEALIRSGFADPFPPPLRQRPNAAEARLFSALMPVTPHNSGPDPSKSP